MMRLCSPGSSGAAPFQPWWLTSPLVTGSFFAVRAVLTMTNSWATLPVLRTSKAK
jgi:hypothetical protein